MNLEDELAKKKKKILKMKQRSQSKYEREKFLHHRTCPAFIYFKHTLEEELLASKKNNCTKSQFERCNIQSLGRSRIYLFQEEKSKI
jgi:hypothetical protein